MCGIIGITSTNNIPDFNTQTILSELEHRGPNNSSHWFSKNRNVFFGHTRLSIIDTSSNGNQPMLSHSKRLLITFNGEIYNHLLLRSEINKCTHIDWKSSSDTETLVNYIDIFGIEQTLDKIEGMYAFSVYFLEEGKLYLCRDRAGEKPLYYGFKNNFFFFSSELKPLKKINFLDLKINKTVLNEFLKYGNIPNSLSIYKEVNKLLPGKLLEFNVTKMKISKINSYWKISNNNQLKSNKEFINRSEFYYNQKLETLLSKSVEKMMISDVSLGCFLSGGIDSSLIASMMQNKNLKKINTFSIGYDENLYDESIYSSRIAKNIGTDHNELIVSDNDLKNIIPSIADIYDEPFADSSQIPTFLLSKFTKQKVTVALSGDGADELFCGYNKYLFLEFIKNLPSVKKNTIKFITKFISPNLFNILYNIFSNLIDKKYRSSLPREHYIKISNLMKYQNIYEYIYQLSTNNYDNNSLLTAKSHDEFESTWKSMNENENELKFIKDFDFNFYLPNDILVKVDRASMANSLEVRCPYLDKDVIEFSNIIPNELMLKNNTSKYILKNILSKYIDKKLFERPKMGFGVPIDLWMRGTLKDWTLNNLENGRKNYSDIFNFDSIKKKWEMFLLNKGNYHHELWNIIILINWLDKYE
jgi:asparagine synthase (glutamine-hydrolysing)